MIRIGNIKRVILLVINSIALCVFCLPGSSFAVFAQDCKKIMPDVKIEVQELERFDAKNYEGWKRIDIPNKISFYVPSDFEKVEINGKPGSHPASASMEFKNKDFGLGGDFTTSAYAPNITKKMLPSYCEWYSWIDGAFAYFWNFEEATERKKYESGIYFQFREDKNYRMSIYLQSKDKNTKETAEKIFKSVIFLNKPIERKIPKN